MLPVLLQDTQTAGATTSTAFSEWESCEDKVLAGSEVDLIKMHI